MDNKPSQPCPQPPSKSNEWGSDDDSELFLSVLEPDLTNQISRQNSPKPQTTRKVVNYSPKENLQPLVVPKPKFPGPAGLPLPALSSANVITLNNTCKVNVITALFSTGFHSNQEREEEAKNQL